MKNPDIEPPPGAYEPKSLREYDGLFGKRGMTKEELREYEEDYEGRELEQE